MIGISAYGAYIPRMRLSRKAVLGATGWLNPALMAHGRGEKAVANWDEDSVTLAVAAARDCHAQSANPSALYFASTTPPFSLRLNASIVGAALGLESEVSALDVTSSDRCGLSALIQAADHVKAGEQREALVVASDVHRNPAASASELTQGDGAAALRLSSDNVLAEIVGTHAETLDFVDAWRGTGEEFTYRWEERWIRDEGCLKIIPAALQKLLEKTQTDAKSVDRFICTAPIPRLAPRIAKVLGVPAEAVADHLEGNCGDTGAAHPLLLLSHALENAKPGQTILVAGFGQGCEAVLLRTTEQCGDYRPAKGPTHYLANGQAESNYFKALVFRDLVSYERGSVDQDKTSLSAAYRDRGFMNNLRGLHCSETGETFFGPEAEFKAGRRDQAFAWKSFTDSTGRLLSWSANYLGQSMEPAISTAIVEFEEGGRLVMDITEADPSQLKVGLEVTMSYRVHGRDEARGFTRYFWKAVPKAQPQEDKGGKA